MEIQRFLYSLKNQALIVICLKSIMTAQSFIVNALQCVSQNVSDTYVFAPNGI